MMFKPQSLRYQVALIMVTALAAACSTAVPNGPTGESRADATSLEGRLYTRTFTREGLFGQPAGEFTHSLNFGSDTVTDNGDTFFGNPPATSEYAYDGVTVLIENASGNVDEYSTSADARTLTHNETGAVLTLVELAGQTFSRTVVSDGSFGQPTGERQHSLVFGETEVTDNGDTFFGNPPSAESYSLSGHLVIVGSTAYQLSLDGTTLTLIETGAVFTLVAPATAA